MINEYSWAEELYKGNRSPSTKNNYGDCMYLARYLIQNGNSVPQSCNLLYDWGKENHIYFDNRIVLMCQKAEKMQPLRDFVDIHISEEEINTIKTMLKKKNSQIVALAMLCYAKAFHAPSESFDISTYQLELWTGIQRENISGRYIKEIESMGIIKKVEPSAMDYWKGFAKSKMNKYKFCFPLLNEGKYVLNDNNIIGFFESL